MNQIKMVIYNRCQARVNQDNMEKKNYQRNNIQLDECAYKSTSFLKSQNTKKRASLKVSGAGGGLNRYKDQCSETFGVGSQSHKEKKKSLQDQRKAVTQAFAAKQQFYLKLEVTETTSDINILKGQEETPPPFKTSHYIPFDLLIAFEQDWLTVNLVSLFSQAGWSLDNIKKISPSDSHVINQSVPLDPLSDLCEWT